MTILTGTKVDSRDGHVYKTVLMPDGKWWFRDNLRWAGGTDFFPPNGNSANVSTYGYLYGTLDSSYEAPGTHIASESEQLAMMNSLGLGTAVRGSVIPPAIAIALASVSMGGTDAFGFNALPAGYKTTSYFQFGSWATYRVGTPSDGFYLNTAGSSAVVQAGWYNSVRLIVDSGNIPDVAPTNQVSVGAGGIWKTGELFVGSGGVWKPGAVKVGGVGGWK